MIRIIFLLLLLFQSSCFVKCIEYQDNLEIEKIKKLSKSTVRIDVTIAEFNKEKKIIFKSWSGTGVVLDTRKRGSLILTAGHLCNMGSILYQQSLLHDINNNSVNGFVLKQDVTNDLCLMMTEKPIGKPIKLAKKMPQIWSKVIYLGSPIGMFSNGVGFVGEGRFLGLRNEDNRTIGFSNVPATIGSSGSGLFHNDELIGLINEIQSLNFSNGTVFVPLDAIYKFLDIKK